MMTRSFSDLLAVVIAKFLLGVRRLEGAEGSGDLAQPLSAQAQTPSRPSGADKKQEPAETPGGQGRSGNRGRGFCPGPNSRHFAANQHAKPLDDAEILGQNN
jgi:hypothetical protein